MTCVELVQWYESQGKIYLDTCLGERLHTLFISSNPELLTLGVAIALICAPIVLVLMLKWSLVKDQIRLYQEQREFEARMDEFAMPAPAPDSVVYHCPFGEVYFSERGAEVRLRQRSYTREEMYRLAHWLNVIHTEMYEDQIAQEVA